MSKIKEENLTDLITFIKDISNRKEYGWFKEKLILSLNENLSNEIFSNTETIKKYLSISPEISIDYSFISHKILRNRLESDNLRMENVRLNLSEKDELKRLYDFIIYAFYQVENLINYYFHIKFDIKSMLNHFESLQDKYFTFQRSGKEQNVSDISLWVKLAAFNKIYFQGNELYTGLNLDNLRKVRNEGLHRCSIIIESSKNENKRLHNFLKNATYDSIHRNLELLTIKINQNLS